RTRSGFVHQSHTPAPASSTSTRILPAHPLSQPNMDDARFPWWAAGAAGPLCPRGGRPGARLSERTATQKGMAGSLAGEFAAHEVERGGAEASRVAHPGGEFVEPAEYPAPAVHRGAA